MLLSSLLDHYLSVSTRIRSQATREHYRRSLRQFAEHLGHEPTIADLTDDAFARWMVSIVDSGLTAATANQQAKQVRALWIWLAKRRIVECWPTVPNLVEPEPLPEAWTQQELARLFAACSRQTGWIAQHQAHVWWTGLHRWLYDTGERAGATWRLERRMVDLGNGIASVPAAIRKGGRQPMVYRLRPQTVATLARMALTPSETGLVFDHPWKDDQSFYTRYRRLVASAGLPWIPRKTGLHKMRKTVLTQIAVLGGDATAFAGHSSAAVTEAYIDKAIVLAAQRGVWPTDLPAMPSRTRRLLARLIG